MLKHLWRGARGAFGLRQVLSLAAIVIAMFALWGTANAELIYQENFEGDDSGYDIGDESYIPLTPGQGWSPGVWGLNTIAEQIGLVHDAPARRAAILWDHTAFADDFAPESLEVWVSLIDWAVGVADPGARADAQVGFYGGYLEESVQIVHDALVDAGYADGNISELLVPEDVDESSLDVLIHSSVLTSTLFSSLPVPVVSFSATDHDDTAIVGIGAALAFDDAISLAVPTAVGEHPALGGVGGSGADGTIDWTVQGPTTLQGMGKTHNGGTTLATVEDPVTGEPVPAIYVVEEGAPVLGAFNPDPEGDRYIVGSSLNDHDAGEILVDAGPERTLELDPIDVSGKTDVKVTVALAATAADFEASDYLFIEVDPDGNGPEAAEYLAQFWGVLLASDPCDKGLSNGALAGEPGDICLSEDFGDFTFDVPDGATNMVLRFYLLTTWGNEIIGIDNIRVHSGALTAPGDFNANGQLDAGDIDDLTNQSAGGTNPAAYDLNGDSLVDSSDVNVWIKDLFNSWVGDADLNGEFNSSDLVVVLASGTYEADTPSVWSTGDFNGDARTNSSDLVAALADGGYEAGPRAAVASVPEPTGAVLLGVAAAWLVIRRRRR